MAEREPLPRPSGSGSPPLGGWRAWTERVPEGKCLVHFEEGEASHVGARVRFTVDFDCTIDHGTASFLNPLVQQVLDGFAAGAFDHNDGKALVYFELRESDSAAS